MALENFTALNRFKSSDDLCAGRILLLKDEQHCCAR